ncbi:hypothetical protein [uncultured Eubacterium sp.]|uniref:hypothetical protein n=1 Tax=uncultured Eubacterium sp. TaxID=165185 RepID=UPI0025973C25|nr:hypothetical protein [uncultured Eubacterium sp.]
MNVKKMKMQLMATAASVLISGIALTSATYAWYVSNHTVEATTTKISATTNGFILQIATAEQGPQHGGEQTSLAASTTGGVISPSSTNDLINWYVCEGWNGEGKVTSYRKPTFVADGKPGQYGTDDDPHYAYFKSEYILYTINETGYADVYLDASEGSPITLSANGTPTTDTIPKSMRIGITIQNIKKNADKTYSDDGEEELKVVYAPYEETGKGNDAEARAGWTCIGNGTDGKLKPVAVTYPYIYATTYADQNNQNWVATKVGKNYEVSSGTQKIASSVGYDGVKMRVYIWMEGTDADCVNNAAAEDPATYNVNVKLAGISAE